MKKQVIIKIVLATIFLIGFINAAGIASLYHETNPLSMNYGETKIVDLNLQNMVGEEDITVKVIIKQGGDIVTLEKDAYTAAAGTSDTIIPLTIKIPSNYGKQSQTIEIETKTVTSGQGGMVNLGTGWTTTFNVLLSEKQTDNTNSGGTSDSGSSTGKMIALTIAIIALILIIFFVMKRKRKT
jgi:hypothetical protein